MENIKALVFDFGGTLDTDGIHWYNMWERAYQICGVEIDKYHFSGAYSYAEELLNNSEAIDFSLSKLLFYKAEKHLDFLFRDKIKSEKEYTYLAGLVSDYCYKNVLKTVQKTKKVIEVLNNKYSMAVVSNFYGNLDVVLKELDLISSFSIIMDSKIVNERKPNKEIYEMAASMLGYSPGECVMIGDSYEQDIVPSKEAGFNTIMLRKKLKKNGIYTANPIKADFIIETLPKLFNYL